MATPLLTATPSNPPTYSVGQAETFSWVPVEGAGRPLYARATYSVNGGGGGSTDVSSLSTVNRISGFVIPDYNRISNTYYGTSNNLSRVDYKQSTTIVASLSFTYATPTSADNALLAEVIKIV